MAKKIAAILLISLFIAIAFYPVPSETAIPGKQIKRGKNIISPDLAKALAASGPDESLRVIIVIEGHVGMREVELRQRRDSVMVRTTQLGAKIVQTYKRMNFIASTMSSEGIRALASEESVAAIRLDKKRWIPPVPDKKLIEESLKSRITPMMPWVPPHIGATEAWASGIDGSDVTVAVIDTGVNFDHPDLAGTDSGYEVDFTGEGYFDGHGHGTFVASEIASQGIVDYTFGGKIKGVAHGAEVMGIKVLTSEGWGWDSWIIAGIEHAWLNGADIISMSLGGLEIPNDGYDPLSLAFIWVYQDGVLPVVAAGNDGPGIGTMASPGSSPYALTVGASTLFQSLPAVFAYWPVTDRYGDLVDVENDQMIDFSSRGSVAFPNIPKPDISAPGAWVVGIYYPSPPPWPPEEAWDIWAGTSMSTPIVAGTAALVLQALRNRYGMSDYRNPSQLRALLKGTSTDLGYNALKQGSGRVRAGQAVRVALGTSPGIYPMPSSAAFWPLNGGDTQTFTLTSFGSPTSISNIKISSVMPKLGKVLFETSGIVDGAPVYDPVSGYYEWDFWYRFSVPSKTPAITAELMVSKEWAGAIPQGYMRIALYNPEGELVNYNLAGTYNLGGRTAIVAASPGYIQEGSWTLRVHWYQNSAFNPAGRIPFQVQVVQILRASIPGLKITPASISSIPPGGSAIFSVKVSSFKEGIGGAIVVSADGISPVIIPVSINPVIAGEVGTTTLKVDAKFPVDSFFSEGDWHYYYFLVSDTKYVPNLMTSVGWTDLRTDVDVYLAYVPMSGWAEGLYSSIHDARLVAIGGEGFGTMTGGKKDFAYVADPYTTGKLPEIHGLWMLILHTFSVSNINFKGDPLTVTIDRGGGKIAPSPVKIDLKLSRGSSKTVTVKIKNLDVVPASYWVEADQNTALSLYDSQTYEGTLDTGGLYGFNGIWAQTLPTWPWDQALEAVLSWEDATVQTYDYEGVQQEEVTVPVGEFNMSLAMYDPDGNTVSFVQDDDGSASMGITPVMLSPVRGAWTAWTYWMLVSVKSNVGTGDQTYAYRWIIPLTLTVNWYTTLSPWGWFTPISRWIDPVAPGGTASFTMTITVPSDTPSGRYSGYIVVWDRERNFLLGKIPVTITVP